MKQFTLSEYQTATNEIRSMQTQLAERRRTALKAELAKLNSAAGKIQIRRQAQMTAERYIRTAKIAERVALDELRNDYENQRLGQLRIAAAVDEIYGTRTTRRLSTIEEPKIAPPIKHGLASYRAKRCRCNEICRPANAAAQRERRARNDHSTKQPTGQTTKDRSAAGSGGQERAEAA
ncbi:hypothetical protein SEA_NATHANVAAG_39 [Arthrobacter phage NathanVaag]|nr:hypothetical protein SEA_NATHANVAAG_39 [Arthrobacter phage NathanVaag]